MKEKGKWYLTYTINEDLRVRVEENSKHPRGYWSDKRFIYQSEKEIPLKATTEEEALSEGRKIFDKALKKNKHEMYDEVAEVVYKVSLNPSNPKVDCNQNHQ